MLMWKRRKYDSVFFFFCVRMRKQINFRGGYITMLLKSRGKKHEAFV